MRVEISTTARLSGAPRQLVDELRRQYTLPNPAFVEARRQGRWTGNLEPDLQFWRKDGSDLVCPRGAVRDILLHAREHGPVEIVDNRLSLPEIDLAFRGNPRPYQLQAIDGIMAKHFGVLEAGTGSGKTIVALAIIAARKQPALVLVHTSELLYQWQERARQFLGIEAGLIGDGKFDIRPVTIAIVNSVRANLDGLTTAFGHLIVDECHRTPSSMFSEVVRAFPAKFSLGLSATPYRRDGLDPLIGWFVGAHKVTVDTAVLREVGAVLRPKIISRETDFRYSYNDDYSRMISALAEDRERNRLIADDINQQAKQGGVTLVVSDRTEHLDTLAKLADDHGSAILTGKIPRKQRQKIVQALNTGKIRTLYSTLSLVGEGFDCPSMDALFITSPIKFSGRLKQVIGRILRPAAGKQAKVYDYVDNKVGVLKYQARQRRKTYSEMR